MPPLDSVPVKACIKSTCLKRPIADDEVADEPVTVQRFVYGHINTNYNSRSAAVPV